MSLNNKPTSFDFIPYQQPPVSCARDLPLPKRRRKNVKWEKSGECKPTETKKSNKQKAKPVDTTTTPDAAASSLSSPITSESASCSSDSSQIDSVTVNSLDKDDAKLVAALLAYDPSIALVLNVNT